MKLFVIICVLKEIVAGVVFRFECCSSLLHQVVFLLKFFSSIRFLEHISAEALEQQSRFFCPEYFILDVSFQLFFYSYKHSFIECAFIGSTSSGLIELRFGLQIFQVSPLNFVACSSLCCFIPHSELS